MTVTKGKTMTEELIRKAREWAWDYAREPMTPTANLLRDLADALDESEKEKDTIYQDLNVIAKERLEVEAELVVVREGWKDTVVDLTHEKYMALAEVDRLNAQVEHWRAKYQKKVYAND